MPYHVDSLSRRAFLKATAAAAPLVGAGVILPSTASARGTSDLRGHVLVPRAGHWLDVDPHALAQRAVETAVAEGALDARRLANYRKLLREAMRAQQSLREQREQSRQFGAMAKQVMRAKRDRLGR